MKPYQHSCTQEHIKPSLATLEERARCCTIVKERLEWYQFENFVEKNRPIIVELIEILLRIDPNEYAKNIQRQESRPSQP